MGERRDSLSPTDGVPRSLRTLSQLLRMSVSTDKVRITDEGVSSSTQGGSLVSPVGNITTKFGSKAKLDFCLRESQNYRWERVLLDTRGQSGFF